MTTHHEYAFDLDGGRLCLDFVNTLSSTSGEHLGGFRDLVSFARQSHLITRSDADRLHKQAAKTPAEARQVMQRTLRLRSALRGVFSAVAAGEAVPPDDLETMNEELGASLSHARVEATPDPERFGWAWTNTDALDSVLWPIARSAAEVLLSDVERPKVRECGAAECRWLFLDTSKNRSRQWCSMSSCGNREKARRHYERVRARRQVAS
jgi:predicted RNA-binding Zn ribbon-like protein